MNRSILLLLVGFGLERPSETTNWKNFWISREHFEHLFQEMKSNTWDNLTNLRFDFEETKSPEKLRDLFDFLIFVL
jgi:hypothetical protein